MSPEWFEFLRGATVHAPATVAGRLAHANGGSF
jgi:hypothetical protein